jgi:hypothetical protein
LAQLAQRHVELLHHTLGLVDGRRTPYRNHFVAGPGHHDMQDLEALETMGLMARGPAPKFCPSGDVVFRATEAGIGQALQALPAEVKRTRYQEWLDADCNERFGVFLCGIRLPEFETRGERWHGTQEFRMFRRATGASAWDSHSRDVQGEWAGTRKAAKASYKAALQRSKASRHSL